jgi:hypothetical protein
MAAAATPLPKEDSTPPVMKMILVFTSPLLYLAKLNVKVQNGAWQGRRHDGQDRGPGRDCGIEVWKQKETPGLCEGVPGAVGDSSGGAVKLLRSRANPPRPGVDRGGTQASDHEKRLGMPPLISAPGAL